jgi:prophage tail gpP-like protein
LEDVSVIIQKTSAKRTTGGFSDLGSVASGLAGALTASLKSGGPEFRYWSEIRIRTAMDAYSTLELKAPFEPDRKEFRETFRPFSFYPMAVAVGGEQLFTGAIVGVAPEATPSEAVVHVSAYSLPGVLEDCTAPASAVPFEFKKLRLRQIFEKIGSLFKLDVDFQGEDGGPFEIVKLDPAQKVQQFLEEYARLRNRVITNTPGGAILCWRAAPVGRPVFDFTEGQQPLSQIEAMFSPQDYHSEITAFTDARRGRPGAKFSEPNPWLRTSLRPLNFKIEKAEKSEGPEAARAAMGRMFANMASYAIKEIPSWRDPKGKLWTPNTTVSVLAPSVMIYKRTELMIRAVNFFQSAKEEYASLELVLPGAFSGEAPKSMPWDE